jgi:hypothetical protein
MTFTGDKKSKNIQHKVTKICKAITVKYKTPTNTGKTGEKLITAFAIKAELCWLLKMNLQMFLLLLWIIRRPNAS